MSDPVRVHFRRTGGFAGNLPPLELDTSTLPSEEATEVAREVRKASLTSLPPAGEAAPDAYQYHIEIVTDTDRRHFVFSDRDLPDEARALVDYLTRAARRQRR